MFVVEGTFYSTLCFLRNAVMNFEKQIGNRKHISCPFLSLFNCLPYVAKDEAGSRGDVVPYTGPKAGGMALVQAHVAVENPLT